MNPAAPRRPRPAALLTIVFAFAAGAGVGCSRSEDADPDAPEGIYTTFYPVTYFAKRIAGDRLEIICPLPEGEDPIFWKPSPEVIRRYQKAELILSNGAYLEKWMPQTPLPRARQVKTADVFERDFLTYAEATTHSHGSEGEHTHQGVDGHTWLDPLQAIQQAEVIRDALIRIRPGEEEPFRRGFEALEADLRTLDERLAALDGMKKGWTYASHPAYDYLARRYGWQMVNLDLDPDELPTEEQFEEIRARLAEKPSDRILWESAPREETVRRLRDELGLESVVFSPVESSPGGGEDYLSIMRSNLDALASVLR